MKIKILFGGASGERMVSTASAQSIASLHPSAEVWHWQPGGSVVQVPHLELIDFPDPFRHEFTAKNILAKHRDLTAAAAAWPRDAVVIIALHGGAGEDGSVQQIFENAKLAFTGSGSRASQICFNKSAAKTAVKQHYPDVADELLLKLPLTDPSTLRAFFSRHQRLVVKPVADGSSVGLHFINSSADIDAFVRGKHHTDAFIAEPFLAGREFTVGVISRNGKHHALPVTEVIVPQGGVFDYERKYLDKQTREITPAELSDTLTKQAQNLALLAHTTCGCFGYTRTDMIYSRERFYFMETNTLPGMSKSSIIPKQLAAAGIEMREFWQEQLHQATTRRESRS